MSIIAFFLNIFLQTFVIIFHVIKLSKTEAVLSLVVVILHHWRFSFITFGRHLPPFQEYCQGYPYEYFTISTFSEAYCQVICYTSILTFLAFNFTASAAVSNGRFLPTYVFYLTLFPHAVDSQYLKLRGAQ